MSEVSQSVNHEKRIVVLETTGRQQVFTADETFAGVGPNTLYTHSTATGDVLSFALEVVGKRTDVAGDTAAYRREWKVKNVAGVLTLVTLSSSQSEDNAAWDALPVISGTNVLIRVTGVAAQTIKWSYRGELLQVN